MTDKPNHCLTTPPKIAISAMFMMLVFLTPNAIAATYYVDASRPHNSGDGTTWATAKQTISAGIDLLRGGDTLFIADGVYSGNTNRIVNVPNGTDGQYSRIIAQNDWGVQVGGQSNNYWPCVIDGNRYIEVRGIRFIDHSSLKVYVKDSNHIKIIRCASDDNGGNSAGFLASNSSYVLFEECYKYGESRYAFQVNSDSGNSHHIIYRRCVVRWDYSNVSEPIAAFANYDQSHIYYQNCIAIDGKDYTATPNYVYRGTKGFFTPNGCDNTHYDGCIVLNFEGPAWFLEDRPVTNVSLKNCIAWNIKEDDPSGTYAPAQLFRSRPGDGPVTIANCTFGKSDSGLGLRMQAFNSSLLNSIVYGVVLNGGNYAVYDGLDTELNNVFYNNTGGRNLSGGISTSSSDRVNPLSNGLRYLTRIEDGTVLQSLGQHGSAAGATIMKKIGVSGTLYGESGWNVETSENLWPFPNEDVIRADMRTWSKAPGEAYSGSPAMTGARGFCADGQTLTRYIWEYLGNAIPDNIYACDLPGDSDCFFVDSSTGSDANDGSEGSPWATIQHAIDQAGSGSIISVKYTGRSYAPFKLINKSHLTIIGIDGKPEIRGSQSDDGRYVSVVISDGTNNITLNKLDINVDESTSRSNYLGVRMYGGVDYITIRNCVIRNAGERNIMTSSNSNNLTLEKNHIYNARGGHGVYFSNGGHDYVIRDNVFESNHSTGIQFNGDGRYMTNILVERNIFSNNAHGDSPAGSDTPAETLAFVEVQNATAKNNLFFNNGNKGLAVYSDSSPSENVKIYNNTFYVTSDTGRPAIQIKSDSSNNVDVRNNIVVNQGVENVSGADNLLNASASALFISSTPSISTDLKLKTDSDAIDSGQDLSSEGVIVDFDGGNRPSGNGYDIGAYEYASNPDPRPVPNNLRFSSSN